MEPHLLHGFIAHNTGQSMADLTYTERIAAGRPRRPYPTFWRRKPPTAGR